jgi:hypothetical protein
MLTSGLSNYYGVVFYIKASLIMLFKGELAMYTLFWQCRPIKIIVVVAIESFYNEMARQWPFTNA